MKSEWQWMINVELQQKKPRGNPFPPPQVIEYLKRRKQQ
jgi:hypothetical protein